MGEEIAVENGRISEFQVFVTFPWHWIGSYCIPSCITRRPLYLHTRFHWNRNFLWTDGRTDGRTDIWDPLY